MSKKPIMSFIKQLNRPVFTTHELVCISGKSSSAVTQGLNFLEKQGIIFNICRGIWAEVNDKRLSPYIVISYLLPKQRVYVSFISALHLHGIVEQIPQVTTLASTAHTKIIRTRLGTFSTHKISPRFFDGFDWYKGTGNFLIAEPEKALADCLYLSACKKKQFGYFPELDLSKPFSLKKAKEWIKKIPNARIRSHALKKLKSITNKS